ncbi:DNA-protecting protein DprA [Candidatus Kaiserbacteria bacterium CG10_big_fil_rev_8_21_14_0_10_49_17]|uniref:DNA-protecting protein DprA n=1 Tax=Candidatus Kaiserbacteria bacterium CG10_big_fil_rev_8_21_14_0_10_49_17 TaxID=1974609 RepID=A0A2M6WF84_9BACT|nr:MAG: DNA-protecting protein DprA [Candidatus Kaiserbacteria bacterium CG10_big_fil_rev_8_21_14_0_10_49_17]
MDYPLRQLNREQFPPLLGEIPDAPEKLFLKGKLSLEGQKLLCVVGSRKYTPYGKGVCEKLIADLAGYPITIVSGLAIGMDTIAHRAALGAHLPTIAVPGSGLDWGVLYPKSNRGLAREILQNGGALLSEFPPGFTATPYSFPQRNRIMAGMSDATLIIEAGQKSGTLITARLATEYNRDVLTVPGSIFSQSTYGPHMLIRNGATPVTSADDILEALHITPREGHTARHKTLSTDEKQVLELLATPLPRHELVGRLDYDISSINIILSAMELKGLIKEELGEIRRV